MGLEEGIEELRGEGGRLVRQLKASPMVPATTAPVTPTAETIMVP